MSFVHLHVHTTYSLLDGFSDIKKLMARVKELNMPAVAITDHGTMFGVVEFYNAAKAAEIKPIIGLETYVAARGMKDRDAKQDKHSSHLLLLAQNNVGYRNLLSIASAAQLDGFYYYPRIDHEFMESHAEGLIATTGCMAAEVPRLIINEGLEAARKRLDWYYSVFGADNFFFELQLHEGIKELPEINRSLMELGSRYKARYVATNDLHYVNPEDARLQDILLAIQTGSVLNNPNRFRMSDGTYYLRSPDEMSTLFNEVPEAISNTLLIAERCNVDLTSKGYHLPIFEVEEGKTPQSYLRELCDEGMKRRYGEHASDPEVVQRLDYELGIIHQMGFDTYFLIVWDLCRHARAEKIWYNVRGSGNGSVTAYCLDITTVEPLSNGLIFERFLNPGRISMPDIDLDFQDDLRPKMMEYCAQKYGYDKVAQIITFGTMGARAAIRDVGRVMDIPISEVDQVAKLIPAVPGKSITLVEALEEIPELQAACNDPEKPYIKELVDTAAKMEGAVRNVGTHAAGVVITDQPVIDYVPLHRPTSNSEESPIKAVTQFEMSILESLGLLKVDFLGLSTLTVMSRACDLIKARHGISFNLNNIPKNDPETYQFISDGHTAGVFQLEGNGMTRYIMQMKPKTLANVIAMVALFRPGPIEFIPTYIRRMHGEEPITYRHPQLQPILEETYGITVYQEQIMFTAMRLAGYTPSEADNLRKGVAKKKVEVLQKHREKFIKGAVEHGISLEDANNVFDDWEAFARYGFPKGHAADYGVISIQTAYLKTHYTVEYMTALLSASKNESEKVAMYVNDCRALGIAVLPPDINTSGYDFTIEDLPDGKAAIRFGMGAVKNVGPAPVQIIMDACKEGGPFKDLTDLANRVNLHQIGRRPLECLIKVGGLDRFGTRPALLEALDRLIAVSVSHFRAVESGQLSLFGGTSQSVDEIKLNKGETLDRRDQLNWERELLGLYVSDHPLSPYFTALKQKVTHTSSELAEAANREKVVVAGMVTRFRPHLTKDGKNMGFVTIEDMEGAIELVVFPRVWEDYMHLVQVDKVISAEGRVDATGSEPKVLAEKLKEIILDPSQAEDTPPTPTRVSKAAPAAVSKGNDFPDADEIITSEEEIAPWEDDSIPPQPPDAFPDDPSAFSDELVSAEVPIAVNPASQPVKKVQEQGAAYQPLVKGESQPASKPTQAPAAAASTSKPQAVVAPSVSFTVPFEPKPLPVSEPPAPAEEAVQAAPTMADNIPSEDTEGELPRKAIIRLEASQDKTRDVRRLKRIHGALVSCPGKDHFAFEVYENNRSFVLDFPNESTCLTDQLITYLVNQAGEGNLRIQ